MLKSHRRGFRVNSNLSVERAAVNHRGTEGTEDAQRFYFLCAPSVPSVPLWLILPALSSRTEKTCARLASPASRMLLILAMSVLLIFVDGLGVGTRGGHNPLDLLGEEASPLAFFRGEAPHLPHGGVLVRTDAMLGVEGRPQSAAGQTTI